MSARNEYLMSKARELNEWLRENHLRLQLIDVDLSAGVHLLDLAAGAGPALDLGREVYEGEFSDIEGC